MGLNIRIYRDITGEMGFGVNSCFKGGTHNGSRSTYQEEQLDVGLPNSTAPKTA